MSHLSEKNAGHAKFQYDQPNSKIAAIDYAENVISNFKGKCIWWVLCLEDVNMQSIL